jgi:hypothetical protein
VPAVTCVGLMPLRRVPAAVVTAELLTLVHLALASGVLAVHIASFSMHTLRAAVVTDTSEVMRQVVDHRAGKPIQTPVSEASI